MSIYPNDEAELLKIKTQDDEVKELRYKSERHDHENILRSLKSDNESYKKKYKSLNKKKVLLLITEILVGSGLATGTSTMSVFSPSIRVDLTSSTVLLTSIAILITNEYFSKLKIRDTKLRDWINVIILLYEKTLKDSMIKKIDEKEAEKLKQIYNHYIDKKSELMKNTSFKVEDIFTDVISKDTISTEQITKLNNFFSQNDVNININIKFNFFKPRKEKIILSAPPYFE